MSLFERARPVLFRFRFELMTTVVVVTVLLLRSRLYTLVAQNPEPHIGSLVNNLAGPLSLPYTMRSMTVSSDGHLWFLYSDHVNWRVVEQSSTGATIHAIGGTFSRSDLKLTALAVSKTGTLSVLGIDNLGAAEVQTYDVTGRSLETHNLPAMLNIRQIGYQGQTLMVASQTSVLYTVSGDVATRVLSISDVANDPVRLVSSGDYLALVDLARGHVYFISGSSARDLMLSGPEIESRRAGLKAEPSSPNRTNHLLFSAALEPTGDITCLTTAFYLSKGALVSRFTQEGTYLNSYRLPLPLWDSAKGRGNPAGNLPVESASAFDGRVFLVSRLFNRVLIYDLK